MMPAENKGGRPREVLRPYRLNLYVEADFAGELRRLARYLTPAGRRPLSVSQAMTQAVKQSPAYRAMKRSGKEAPRVST